MQQGDFNPSYQPIYPQSNPPPTDHQYPPPPPSYASAPPFSDYSPTYPYNSPNEPSPYPPPPVSHYTPPPPQQQPLHYPPYDPPNYTPLPPNPYPTPDPTPNSSLYPSNFNNFDDSLSRYNADFGRSRSDLGPEVYGKRPESGGGGGGGGLYGSGLYPEGGVDDGVYAYAGKAEPYGARGTVPKSSSSGLFDDYGRAISFEKARDVKVVRAVPKAESETEGKSSVQKFRVKLLPESGSQGVMDVLFQVGLDGIRMLDPNTNRTLRIYPLETVTRCDKVESSTFAFWSKTSVDIDPRRIRLQSNSYTTNTLLDTVTATIVQFKEMGGRSMPPESSRIPERPVEKKKGLTDWIVKLKPVNEEKDHWVPDEAVAKCTSCATDFSAFVRRHHCRNCGDIFCDKCTQGRTALTADENAPVVRACDRCMAEVFRRLSNATKETTSRSSGLHSHENLAKKLQDEMERNRRSSSGSKSGGSGRRMREVACPTCTVHLQVQVPSSGSETIECGVCQNPFLVSAH